MRKYLTIGETAKMVQMSTSKIRYYEKEGLIKPEKNDENGYRLYGFSQVNKLELIILYKDLGMSLNDIRIIFDYQKPYDYHEILSNSLDSVEQQLENLQKKKALLKSKLKTYEEYEIDNFEIINCPERVVYILEDQHYSNMSVKAIFDLVERHGINYTDYSHDLYTIMTENRERLFCVHDNSSQFGDIELKSYVLPEGRYLSYNTTLSFDETLFDNFDLLDAYAKKCNIRLSDEMIIIEDLNTMLYSMQIDHAKLQVRISD